jgi:hypothetical protein
MQIIVMTSDKSHHVLPGFAHLFNKYWSRHQPVLVCGFSAPPKLPPNFSFFRIGEFAHYPPQRWSDAFLVVLNEVAEGHFVFFMDDYWICRPVDMHGAHMLYDYCKQFQNVLKMDLTNDRLYADPGRHLYGSHTYDNCGYLDLIKSPTGSNYQMSLWCGIFNRDLLKQVVVPNEQAQQIELFGTPRMNTRDDLLVFGTRQAPVQHGNIYQSGKTDPVFEEPGWKIKKTELAEMYANGLLEKVKTQ